MKQIINATAIASAASQAGFSGSALSIAVAIALAESSGNIYATHNNTNGTTDYGLWQINSIHKKEGFDISRAFDPVYNAQWAYFLWHRRGGFGDWATFNNNAYKKYLVSINVPEKQSIPAQPATPVSNVFIAGIPPIAIILLIGFAVAILFGKK